MDLFLNELGRLSYLELENDQRRGLVDEITMSMIIDRIEDNIDLNTEMILNQEQTTRRY